MRCALVVLVLCGTARADFMSNPDGGAWLHYELTEVHRGGAQPTDLVLGGAKLHGFVGNSTVAYHIGIDLAAGSTVQRAGFAYDVALFPVGVALRFGDTGVLALGAGVGAMGAVGTLDDAATWPVELTAEAGGSVRVLARGRYAWLSGAAGHEEDALLGLRIGHGYDAHGFPSGNGYFGGVAYRELAGARYVGAVIGYSIDLGTRRRSRFHQ